MKTYRVVVTCAGRSFNRGLLRKDAIVEVPDNVDLSSDLCFELIDGSVKEAPEKEEVTSLSELQSKQAEAVLPRTGFASNLDNLDSAKKTGRPKKTR